MPFVACFGHKNFEYLKKSPERLKQELLIAKKYGEGNLQFATLGTLYQNRDLYEAAVEVLKAR